MAKSLLYTNSASGEKNWTKLMQIRNSVAKDSKSQQNLSSVYRFANNNDLRPIVPTVSVMKQKFGFNRQLGMVMESLESIAIKR